MTRTKIDQGWVDAYQAEAARLARGVDFAAVILGALFLVADHLIGGTGLLKALDLGRVVAVRIGVVFLRQSAKRLFDLGGAGFCGNTQNVIRVAHPPI